VLPSPSFPKIGTKFNWNKFFVVGLPSQSFLGLYFGIQTCFLVWGAPFFLVWLFLRSCHLHVFLQVFFVAGRKCMLLFKVSRAQLNYQQSALSDKFLIGYKLFYRKFISSVLCRSEDTFGLVVCLTNAIKWLWMIPDDYFRLVFHRPHLSPCISKAQVCKVNMYNDIDDATN